MKHPSAVWLFSLVLAASLAHAQGNASPTTATSGFLADYSQLRPAPDREGVMLFLDKSRSYRPYTRIMFEPIVVVPTAGADYSAVQPDALKRMTDNFLASFRRALEPDYQIVDEPGPDVLRVRAAITGVQLVKPPVKPTDFIPIKAIFNVARSAAGAAPVRAEMTAEIEVLDANGHRVAAATATRKGDRTLTQGEQITWSDLQSIVDYWARGFRQRLDELRGVAG